MRKGFTLIELLVVVLIIGILAAVALPQYTKAVEKSRTAEALTLMGDIMTGERIYQLANSGYTTDLSKLDIEMPGLTGTTPSSFTTKNFTIAVSNVGTGVQTQATRLADTGAGQYKLTFQMNSNGVIKRYCTGDSNSFCKSVMGNEWEQNVTTVPTTIS